MAAAIVNAQEIAMPFRLGSVELIIILVIVTMIFGVGKLPQVGGAMGKALREFRKSRDDVEETTRELVSSRQR